MVENFNDIPEKNEAPDTGTREGLDSLSESVEWPWDAYKEILEVFGRAHERILLAVGADHAEIFESLVELYKESYPKNSYYNLFLDDLKRFTKQKQVLNMQANKTPSRK